MPSLHALNLVGNPSREPLTYPGPLVQQSCLLVDSWTYFIAASRGKKVAHWQVKADGGPLNIRSGTTSLDEALRVADVAPMSEREPMLAVGSNASPGQLLHKFGTNAVLPITRVTVSDYTVGHSAHVSKPGYIPYVAVAAPVSRQHFTIAWLDRRERRAMDSTEPNYTRVLIDGHKAPVVLESGNYLTSYTLYRGRWGALRLGPDQPPADATSQSSVLSALADHEWFRQLVNESPSEAVKILAEDAELRNAVRDELHRRDLVANDGLDNFLLEK